MNLWQSLAGMLRLEITSADPAGMLDLLTGAGVTLYRVEEGDDLTFLCSIHRGQYRRVSSLCQKKGASLKIRGRMGLYWKTARLKKRPVLLAGTAVLLSLALFLPTRVLFLSVEGNREIPANRILEAAADCGIRFGVSRRAVRSEKMKNALLSALPELKWAGINTAGCRAVISVRERESPPEAVPEAEIAGMVAVRDGIVTACTVTRGNALCAPGQSVIKGQLLISPYVDCGMLIKAVAAEGEVYARTERKIRAVTPAECVALEDGGSSARRYSMILGKKRINFWKGSGISDATCGRMYEEYYITLPGGFRLPVCLAAETLVSRKESVKAVPEDAARQLLAEFSAQQTEGSMVAGRVLSKTDLLTGNGALFTLDTAYVCHEMIGRLRAERNGEWNEE